MIGRTNVGGGGGAPAVLEQKTVSLDMAGGDQEITPSTGYDGLSKVLVRRPATLASENIKDGEVIGGVTGAYQGTPIANNLDGLVDGTITTFTMPQGKTTVQHYLFEYNTSLTYANLQGATIIKEYAFRGCTNAEIILPSTLTNVGQAAFINAGISTALMELDLASTCTVAASSFNGAKLKKIKGTFSQIGSGAFQSLSYLQEVDISASYIEQNAFTNSGSSFTKLHVRMYGSGYISNSAFANAYYISDLVFTGYVKTLSQYAFYRMGYARTTPSQNILKIDLSSSAFTLVGSYCFAGQNSASALNYFEIVLPSTCTSIDAYGFAYIKNSDVYFKGNAPTIQSTTFTSISNTNLFVPFEKADGYRTKTNWVAVAAFVKGYAEPNTFQTGDTLPAYNQEGYALTWYSDKTFTTQITTVPDGSQMVYCDISASVAAYKVNTVIDVNTNVTYTDGTNTYISGDFVPVGTTLTVAIAPTSQATPDVFDFSINGTDYSSGSSATITVSSDINVTALYYDGVNNPISTTLNDCSWNLIKYACDHNYVNDLWAVGSTKTDNNGMDWQLVDRKAGRYSKVNGGVTHAVFMSVPLFSANVWASSTSTVYINSNLYYRLQSGGDIFRSIDTEISSIVNNDAIIVKAQSQSGSGPADVQSAFFAPSVYEIAGYSDVIGYQSETSNGGVYFNLYEYFSDSSTSQQRRIKYYNNVASIYFLRSRYDYSRAWAVWSNGNHSYTSMTSSYNAVACFAL